MSLNLEAAPPPGMIVREKDPLNLEMPFAALDGFITPNDRFYVRSHNAAPAVDLDSWRLVIEGDVDRPCAFDYAQISAMDACDTTVTMECAGNGRAFLEPQRPGAQWEGGAVGTAVWSGVPLARLLSRAGVRASACEVILIGADRGEIKDPPRPAGQIHYARSLPLAKAADDVLLALRMNGRPLAAAHGFPLRAVVPGWYGMAATKWLTRVVVTSAPFQGYYQTIDYAWWDREAGPPTLRPITEIQVKAQIARPAFAEVVAAGARYRVFGAAWSGDAPVTRVEVSTDAGANWHDATLLGDPVAAAWRLWEYHWQVPDAAGDTTLMARATDARGRVQPPRHDDDRGSYLINHWLPVSVRIR